MRKITAARLTRKAFLPFGQVIDTKEAESFLINNSNCRRFHDLAKIEAFGPDARVLLSIFRAEPCEMPLLLTMVERHPFGSQAFMPLSPRPFLIIVCPDEEGRPGRPQAFLSSPGQGVNYSPGTWHGVLTPLGESQDFLVVDRGGSGKNLQEYFFEDQFKIQLPQGL